ncbi:protein GDAP2 homolog isoform X1 [Plutella xylostella]|uniref:protein GDAP2 homolog isoform X1 n=1 Tax=Plutella xylostella TaxID=51655 RepID=UPI002032ACED|nr:protein GDAP2 homolog isoform X1 [Plutella xylostella]XP_011555499.3 protein GDAP2 homolog isoform X1 [Plutella xylostella]
MRGPGGRGGVPCAAVARWAHSPAAPLTDYSQLAAPHQASVVFQYEPEINDRFAIWQGDITTLEVDALVTSTDERLLGGDALSERVLLLAGPGMKEEIVTRGLECRTGEAVATPGFALRCRHVLHTVSPKYLPKYHTAAEGALTNCYRNVLCLAAEVGAKSLALCVINQPRRNFPPDVAAHVALRTIRRFLEQNKQPHLVILATECGSDAALLTSLAPLYFPRSDRDADAARWRLVDDAQPERRIRIIHNPTHLQAEDDSSAYDGSAAAEAAAVFGTDTQLLLSRPAPAQHPRLLASQDQQQYERLLRRAHSEDLSEVSGIGCLYQSGVDRLGRPVVVFIGKWFPIGDIDLDKALLYLIKLLDPIVNGDYVIAYFHTLAASGNHPPFSWLKEVYTVLPYKYKKNLKAFYIVHPTFWTKMMTWWFTTFMAPAIKAKVHSLPGVEFLYSVMRRDQLELPAFVTEYDMTINGLHYFQPDTNAT